MGRKRCFLGFFVGLFLFAFSANSFAEGYSCEKTYISCNAGYYLDGSSQCAKCPTNYPNSASDNTTGGINNCYLTTTAGKYVATAGAGETTCTAGGYCPGGVTVHYDDVGGRTACSAGTYNASTGSSAESACIACATGSYNTGTGNTSCTACAAGKTTSGTGKTSCDANCANASNVANWETTAWNNNIITNLCTIKTCSSKYVRTGSAPYACSACLATKGTGVKTCTASTTSNDNKCVYSVEADQGYTTNTTQTNSTAGATSYTCTATPNTINFVWAPTKGTAPTTPASCTYGETFNAATAPTVDNWSFGSWVPSTLVTKSFGSGQTGIACTYENLGVYSGTVTFTGNYSQDTFTVTYNLNGGDGTKPANKQCASGVECTLASGDTNSFYRAGYVFGGWATSASATTGSYTITITTDKTVYAVWTACGYNKYKASSAKANAACETCPTAYPHTESTTSTAITQCFSETKQRTSSGAHIETLPNGCVSATFQDCTPATCDYVAYSNATGTADGTIKSGCETNTNTCNKTVVAPVVAAANYFASTTATNCTLCSASNSTFPYSVQGTTDSNYCYRECKVSDVAGSKTVSGIYHKNGENNCAATACAENYYLSGNGCNACVPHATCPGDDEPFSCTEGYKVSDDGTYCEPLEYQVTLNANEGTCGTGCKSSVTATYDAHLPALSASELPTRATWSFAGYFDAQTGGTQYYSASGVSLRLWDKTTNTTLYAHWSQNTVQCQAGKYYDGEQHVDCPTDGKYCPGTGTAIEGSAGCFVACTTLGSEYTKSDAASTTSAGCYKTCNTATCVEPSTCPTNSTNCSYDTENKVAGISYYGSSACTNVNNTACQLKQVWCKNRYFENTETRTCESCSTTGYNQSILGNTGGACGTCYTTCSLYCTPQVCPANNKTCTQNENAKTSGADYYCDGTCNNIDGVLCGCTAMPSSCAMTYTCMGNYDKNATAGTCDPKVYTITLDLNGAPGTNKTIYEKYSIGWSLTNFGTTVTKITPPTWENHTFMGYYTVSEKTGGVQVIDASGNLSVATTIGIADTAEGGTASTAGVFDTLYARWSTNLFTCTAGLTGSDAECPAGFYCPGGQVDYEDKDKADDGCHKTCPTDTSGGAVTSPAGSSAVTACKTTRTGVALANGTGGGDQVCNYVDDSSAGYKNCESIKIKYCSGGYYRVAEDSSTCEPAGKGNWSPAPTNNTEDAVSMARYPCSALPGHINSTTEGEKSALPTACYNSCSSVNVTDNGEVIGTRAPVAETVSFAGTITAYNPTNKTVTTSGTFGTCTWQNPVCVAGYHTSGTTCEPNIYTFILAKDGGTGGTDGPIYMKYGKGWYSNAAATNAITSIVLPTKGSQNCSGYDATIGGTQVAVINGTGQIVATNKLVNYTDTTTTTTLTASWVAKKTKTCNAGQYFDDADNACKSCPNGSWCPGGVAYSDEDRDGQNHFINACPTAVAGTTYTPAQTWNGTALSNVAPSVGSDNGRDEESDCFATVQYSADHGKGKQVCHYSAGKYNSDCNTIEILTCNSGWWLDTTKTTTDCSLVGYQYYSATNFTARTRCPEAVYDVDDSRNTISTDGDESGSIEGCVREGIWEKTTHGGRTKRCHWSTVNNTYSINCGNSYTMRKCDAGYYDELDGATSTNENLDCVAVGDGNWSPAPTNWNETNITDTTSTKLNVCPAGTDTSGDVVSNTPNTGSATNGKAITDCYLTCKATKNLNGTTVNVVSQHVSYNTTTNAYNKCIYSSNVCPEDMWCDTDGFHDCPTDKDGTPGKAALVEGQKYRGIETCYVTYNPYTATTGYPNHNWANGTGFATCYYNGTEVSGDYNNCMDADALTCNAGYFYRVAGSFACSGTTSGYYSGDGATTQTECPAGWAGSTEFAASYTACYTECDKTPADFANSKTVSAAENIVYGNSATTYNACSYNVVCKTGYDVKNNNTAAPTCDAHEYTITLNKNGGTGSTAPSVKCTFDSGACALPAIVDTRTGYSTANKWCTAANGGGTCYNAGTTVTTNISSDASDIELFAQWTPNVYEITLNHNGATTAGSPAKVYLKYATGWYSNAAATTAITTLTTKPVKGVLTFAGYTGNNVSVVDADGKFVTTTAALTFTTSNATVSAQWTDAPITCPVGKYYRGAGENPTTDCLPCTANNYCPGVTVVTNSGQAGIEPCPDDGKSPANSESSAACYKELLPTYVATHGRGTQTCYYNETALAYSDRCKDFVITSCDAGHWLATTTGTDCSAAGVGYYSANNILTRDACPNGGTTKSDNTTAETVQECFKANLAYAATDGSGTGTQSCWYSNGTGNSAVYGRDCFDKVITKCRGGYYLAAQTDIACTVVDFIYYSIEDELERHACPNEGKTSYNNTSTISECWKNGQPYVAEHGGGERTCKWSVADDAYLAGCGTPTMLYCDAGYWLANATDIECSVADYAYYSPDRDLARYACPAGTTTRTATSESERACFVCPENSVCEPGQEVETCEYLTGGLYPKSEAGTIDKAYCYRDCTMGENANAMSGHDYYTATDTCAITSCASGYTLSNGQCVTCPAGSFCDGTPGGEGGNGAKSCADLGDGSWMYSAPGATKASDCYRKCTGYVEDNCTLSPVETTAYWPNNCQYTGTSATGNPAEVVDGHCIETACISNYEMVNGSCKPCNRENALSYKPDGNCIIESCVIGYHPYNSVCEEDVKDCTDVAPNATVATQKWDAAHGAFGICTIKSCEDGFHLASNACVENEQVCNVPNGVGTKTWNTATGSWNECIATSCVPGYTNDPYEKNNASEQCSACRNKFSVLGEVAAASYSTGCEIASCLYQGEKYNLDNNECVPICDRPYSDETGSLRWNNATKKCERTCNPGYISW